MVNDSHYPIPQLEENKKLYTARDINRVDCARKLQNTTVQPIKQTLHSVDNKILHNLSIFWEDVGMDEDIYGPSVPYFQGKIVCHNIKHVEPMMVPNVPNDILDKYKKVTLWCDLMHINVIGFLNTIPQQIMFATESIIKNRKIKNIEDVIRHACNIYLQHGLKITWIHADSEF